MTEVTSIVTNKKGGQWYTLFLVLLPVILMYRTPGLSVGLSTALVAITMPYAITIIFNRSNKIAISLLWPLFIYLIYAIFKGTSSSILLCIAIGVHLSAISTGIINTHYLRQCIENVSIFAALCVTLQQLVHATTGVHIPMIYPGGLIDGLKDYSVNILTGIPMGGETMYRPCAFFLEPSHMSQYCIIGLGSSLFRMKPAIKNAIVISIGLIMTTSGMGVVLTFGMWAWWIMNKNNLNGNGRGKKNSFFLLIGLVLLVVVLYQIPFFQSVVSRFTSNPDDDYNAITGRTLWWDVYFGEGQLSNFVYGMGLSDMPEEYFTGIMTQLYAYGIIGTFFFLLYIVILIIRTKGLPRTFTTIYLALLFLANLTGFISIIFNFGVILSLYSSKQNV